MSIFDKRISKEERASLELAEQSRQLEWKCPSFAAGLFRGKLSWNLIWPYPQQPQSDKEEGDKLLVKLEKFLRENLNPDQVDETREIPEKVIKGLFEMGIFAIKIPKEYKGLGLSQTNYNRVIHLIGSYCGSTAALISAHQSIGVPQPLINFGTEEQKRKYLPKFRENWISGFALTESEAGSDPRLMKTVATPTEDGKYYLLTGEKLWCTNGNIADVLVVMAHTPPKIVHGKERKQITAFIVETKTPGFEISYRCKFMGLNAIQNGVMKFNNVKVPKENIILGEGQGLKLAFITLNTGRLTLPAAVIGMSKWCLSVSRRWAKERKQWGSPIGAHEAVAAKLSDMAASIFAMDAMSRVISHMADNKKCDIRLEAAIAKLFCTEESWKNVYEAIQIRGGRGYETAPSLKGRGKPDFALERAMRDSRVNTILEGSSEIMHLFIAREALDFHLNLAKTIFDRRASIFKKVKAAVFMGITYIFWYPGLWIPCLIASRKTVKPLKKHMKFARQASRKLAREIFHKMAIYQKKLASKQIILNRLVDIGMDIFAISCACSYAGSLANKEKTKENSLKLADLFCHQATERIKSNFKQGRRNADKLSASIAAKIIGGDYHWLEEEIIK